jgi:hypothetical protein
MPGPSEPGGAVVAVLLVGAMIFGDVSAESGGGMVCAERGADGGGAVCAAAAVAVATPAAVGASIPSATEIAGVSVSPAWLVSAPVMILPSL